MNILGNNYRENMRHGQSSSGFTLVEILVVVVILGILAGLIVPRIMGRPEEARRIKARMQMESLESALKLFKLDNGFYPDTDQGLNALIEKPGTGREPNRYREEGYMDKDRVPLDPWSREFIYISPGIHNTRDFDLLSLGSDGEEGGEGPDGDITNWESE